MVLVGSLPAFWSLPAAGILITVAANWFVKFLNGKTNPFQDLGESGSTDKIETFANVEIIVNRFKEATVVATVATVYILMFVVVVAAPLAYFVFQFPPLPTVLLLGAFAIVLGFVSFLSSYVNNGSRYQNYSGNGTVHDSTFSDRKIIVSEEGIQGLLSLPQNMVSLVTQVDSNTIRLDTRGSPNGFPAFLSNGVLTLRFTNPEDTTKFKEVARLWKSLQH